MTLQLRNGLLGAASSLILAPAALGQTASTPRTAAADAQTVGEVVVTAQRRDQSLSRTPVSVAVISSDTLSKAQVVSEDDLREAAPGLQIRSGGTSNQINYAIRGESQDPFSNVRPGVLPYINDVQIGGQGGASVFYDLQSVQVLKGPQGTLFGRSATGGAILFTTQKPTDQLGGYLSVLGGNYDAQKAEGAVNVPVIGDRVMLRIAGFERSRDGYQENLYDGKHVGEQRQYGGRVSLKVKLGPKFQNELVVDYLHSNGQNTSAVLSGLLPYTGVGAPYIPIQYLYSGTATPTATITGECTLQGFVGLGACPPVNPAVAGFYTSYFSDPHHPANGIAGQLADQQARGPYVVNTDSSNIFRTNNTVLTDTASYEIDDNHVVKNIVGLVYIDSFTTEDSDGAARLFL
jgi:iron complex outermembrane receptor protein